MAGSRGELVHRPVCHVLIALYDGNDDDITVGGAAETVKFNRDGVPAASANPRIPLSTVPRSGR